MHSLLQLTDTQISTWVATFMLPLFRVASMLMVMPVFGTTLVPRRIRLYFAFAITVVITPNLPPMPAVSPLDLSGLLLIAEQIIIGAVLGFSLQLFFQAFVVAGQIVAIQMGMGFASMVAPANGVSVALIGLFFTMLVTLLFLSMNGHLVVFEVLTESFTTLPVGGGLMTTVIATAKYRRTRRGIRVVPNTGMTISIDATRNSGNMKDATQVLIWVSVS